MRKRLRARAPGRGGCDASMQEEIFAAKRRNAGILQDPVGKIFIRCQRCSGGIVLRIPRTSPGAEMNASGLRCDPEQKPRSAVDVLKRQAEFSTGIFRVDRLVRIGARLSRSKLNKVSHAISGGLAFDFRSNISNEIFIPARGN